METKNESQSPSWAVYFAVILTTPFIFHNGWWPALYIHAIALLQYSRNSTLRRRALLCVQITLLSIIPMNQFQFPLLHPFTGLVIVPLLCIVQFLRFASIEFHLRHNELPTMVLPALWIAIHTAVSMTPFLNLGSLTASQVDNSLFIYLVSIFGAEILTFLPVWLACIVDLKLRKEQTQAKWYAVAWLCLLLAATPGTHLRNFYHNRSPDTLIKVSCNTYNIYFAATFLHM